MGGWVCLQTQQVRFQFPAHAKIRPLCILLKQVVVVFLFLKGKMTALVTCFSVYNNLCGVLQLCRCWLYPLSSKDRRSMMLTNCQHLNCNGVRTWYYCLYVNTLKRSGFLMMLCLPLHCWKMFSYWYERWKHDVSWRHCCQKIAAHMKFAKEHTDTSQRCWN